MCSFWPLVYKICTKYGRIRKVIKTNEPQQPIAANSAEYEKFYKLYTQLYPALKDSYKALANL